MSGWKACVGALAVLLLARVGGADPNHRSRGSRGPMRLLSMPEVRRELKLETAQFTQVEQLDLEMQARSRQVWQELRSSSYSEREKRYHALRAEHERRLADILDARQYGRLRELQLQHEGITALRRKELADSLRLPQEQRARIEAIFEGERESLRAAFQGFRTGPNMTMVERESARRIFREVRAATEAKLTAVLTEAQRRQFQALQGTPFRFPEEKPE